MKKFFILENGIKVKPKRQSYKIETYIYYAYLNKANIFCIIFNNRLVFFL